MTSLAPLPLSRADLWEPLLRHFEYYNVVLLLKSAGQVVASNSVLTSTGTDTHQFSVNVPANATGPFTWTAYC